jgi:glycosyltransferase involved in cell wall biosynthesis
MSIRFSIITPSFRSGRWLKMCLPSVADQGVELEHLVQDSESDDGTGDWLPHDPRAKVFIEKDKGMYDAVNRGLRRATGDVCAYLNCDEQYLPGALADVRDFFLLHPNVEVVFADAIVVNSEGEYLCHRPAMLPTRYHSMVTNNLAILTCATFFRRRVFAERGLFFDTRWRDLGDAHWVLSLLSNKVPMAVLRRFTTTFTDTGENMNLRPNAIREKAETVRMAPLWARKLRHLVALKYRLRKSASGLYSHPPFTYSIYTAGSLEHRVSFTASKPTVRWIREAPNPIIADH